MSSQPKINSQGKEGEKSNYIWGIITKEEFQKFMERLKENLGKTDNKKGDKKYFEFEVRGTKEDLNGMALEIFSFDKTRYCEFFNVSQALIKDALFCVSLSLYFVFLLVLNL